MPLPGPPKDTACPSTEEHIVWEVFEILWAELAMRLQAGQAPDAGKHIARRVFEALQSKLDAQPKTLAEHTPWVERGGQDT